MNPPNLDNAIFDCIANGKRLKEDAETLIELGRAPTALAVAVLAQEEFAKAFLLVLARREVIPWTKELQRSLQSHECKHLVGVMMEWLKPSLEEELARVQAAINGNEIEFLPLDVAVAINILRHEKFEQFRNGFSTKDAEDKGFSRKISKGFLDRLKQSGLYVGITDDGAVNSLPLGKITMEIANKQILRAAQYCEFASDASSDCVLSFNEYRFFCNVVKAVFQPYVSTSSPDDISSS